MIFGLKLEIVQPRTTVLALQTLGSQNDGAWQGWCPANSGHWVGIHRADQVEGSICVTPRQSMMTYREAARTRTCGDRWIVSLRLSGGGQEQGQGCILETGWDGCVFPGVSEPLPGALQASSMAQAMACLQVLHGAFAYRVLHVQI